MDLGRTGSDELLLDNELSRFGSEVPSSLSIRSNAVVVMALRVAGIGSLGALWQVAAQFHWLDAHVLPSFSSSIASLGHLMLTLSFWHAVVATLQVWSYGMAITLLVGIPLGVVLGSSPMIFRWTKPTIEALRPIPPIVLLPLAIIIFKAGLRFSAVLVVQGALWPLVILTSYGVDTVPAVALDTARIYKLGLFRRVVFVRIAQALPLIASGLRIAAATAFAVSIMVGLVAGGPGLGQLLAVAGQGFNLPLTFALTMAVGLLGLVVLVVFASLERRLTKWKPASS